MAFPITWSNQHSTVISAGTVVSDPFIVHSDTLYVGFQVIWDGDLTADFDLEISLDGINWVPADLMWEAPGYYVAKAVGTPGSDARVVGIIAPNARLRTVRASGSGTVHAYAHALRGTS